MMELNREYEFTLLTPGDLSDEDKQKVLEKYTDIFTDGDGEILKKDDWGVKKLAYPIKKSFRAAYTHYDFVNSDTNALSEMERLLKIDDKVLRYMLIRTGEDIDVQKRKEELAKQPEPKEEGRD